MVFKGGNRRTGETTTLLGDSHVLKGKNFIPDGDGVSVRAGMTAIAKMAVESPDSESRTPIAMKTVNIAGEDVLIIISKTGLVEAVFPRRTGMIYKVYRRFYDVEERVVVCNQTHVPNYAEILEVGNYIYLLSVTRSWVIYRDGLLQIKQTDVGKPSTDPETDRIVVDALDATIFDLDYESLKLTKTGKTGAYLRKGDYLSARMRSEFGGRGAPSSSTRLHETDSYVVEVGNSLKRNYFGCTRDYQAANNVSDRYYPVCYLHSKDAVQRLTSGMSDAAPDDTRSLKVLKNVFAYGVLALYTVDGTTATVTVACKTGDDNHLKIGTRVGLTVPQNHYDATHNTTWVDATIVANPDPLPDTFSDSVCITFEYEIPAFGDLAYGPYGLFDPATYDADADFDIHPFGVTAGDNYCFFPMWQTIDQKKYFTGYKYSGEQMSAAGARTHYCIAQVYASSIPITTMLYSANNDILQNPLTLFGNSEVLNDAGTGTINGLYVTANAGINPDTYETTPPYMLYRRTVAEDDKEFYVFTGNTKSMFTSNGNLDGSVVTCSWTYGEQPVEHVSTTWFKDRWYFCEYPVIKYVETEGQESVDKYFFAPLIVISEPHGCNKKTDLPYAELSTYITAPSEKCGRRFPVNVNLWYEPKYLSTNADYDNTAKMRYNPYSIVDERGNPIIQTESPSYAKYYEHVVDNALVLCYAIADVTSGDGESTYRHGYYEIYRESVLGDSVPMKIGEEMNLLKLDINLLDYNELRIDRPDATTDATTGSNFTYYLMHSPIYLSNVEMMATPTASTNTRSVGDFNSCAYFNGKMYFSSQNTLKGANEYLEWDEINTYQVGGNIRQLIALNSMLFMFTDDGIYTMNSKGEISKFSSIKAVYGATFGERLLFAAEDGRLYHTEFSPIPVGESWRQTNDPYLIKVDDTEIIQNMCETWTIYDMAALDDRVYVATSKGVWVYHAVTKSWWQEKYPYEVLRLVRWKDKVIAVGGSYINIMSVNTDKFGDTPIFYTPPS